MGRRGPKALSLEEARLKNARVTPRNRPSAPSTGTPGGEPIMREGLSDEVAGVWAEIVPDLIRRRIVGARDSAGLEVLCGLIAASRSGALSASLAAELRSWLRAFALLPDSRLREVEPPPPGPPSVLDRYLNPTRRNDR